MIEVLVLLALERIDYKNRPMIEHPESVHPRMDSVCGWGVFFVPRHPYIQVSKAAFLLRAVQRSFRVVGQRELIASQTAFASFASVLLLFTYGLANCGAMNFTVKPRFCNCRPQ
jgi:hypothetical protein